jgi:hypothetical protein
MGTGDLSPGVKQLGCEADNSSPSSAKVKNMWSCTSTPLYVFLIKHRDNFTITIIPEKWSVQYVCAHSK